MTEDGGAFGKGYIEAGIRYSSRFTVFGCHFIGDPVMPGCLGFRCDVAISGFLPWLGRR